MVNYVPLSIKHHKNLCLNSLTDLSLYKNYSCIPVYSSEVSRLAYNYPLVFIKQDGQFSLQLMCSLFSNTTNVFIDGDGKWLGGVVPAYILQGPFKILQTNNIEKIICLDENSDLFGQAGEPLFVNDLPSPFLKKYIEFISDLYEDAIQTEAKIALLDEFGLITELTLNIKSTGGKAANIKNFYTLDESKLNDLEDEKWLTLKNRGILSLVYNQLTSINHIKKISYLLNKRGSNLTSSNNFDDIDGLFDEQQDTNISFDFL